MSVRRGGRRGCWGRIAHMDAPGPLAAVLGEPEWAPGVFGLLGTREGRRSMARAAPPLGPRSSDGFEARGRFAGRLDAGRGELAYGPGLPLGDLQIAGEDSRAARRAADFLVSCSATSTAGDNPGLAEGGHCFGLRHTGPRAGRMHAHRHRRNDVAGPGRHLSARRAGGYGRVDSRGRLAAVTPRADRW